jgi:glycogen(starch) synthase
LRPDLHGVAKIRVAVLSWESLYTIQVGGLAVASTRLAEGLANAGYHVSFFTRSAPGQPEYMHINGVHYHTCQFDPGPNSLAFAYNMSHAFLANMHRSELYEGKFDLVHGHDWLVVDALHELKRTGYPIVLTFHSTEYGRNGGVLGDFWESSQIAGKEWYGGYIATRVTTVSQAMKNELNAHYQVPLDKIAVIPNALDPAHVKLKVDRARIRSKYQIDRSAPTILAMGRLEYQKGPDILLEAIPAILREHPTATFLFAGEGSMSARLKARCDAMGVGESTHFLGFVPHSEVLEILNSVDMVCIPSRNEPFGMVLLEAWAAQKPVVAADVGGLSENINDGVNGLKVSPSPSSLAEAICSLLGSPSTMRKFARNGAKNVKNFSWRKIVGEFLETYSMVLRKSPQQEVVHPTSKTNLESPRGATPPKVRRLSKS